MIYRWLALVALMATGLLLAACATLSEEQCQAGDWRSIGFSDGAEGRPAGYVSNHAEACSEYGIALDRALYEDGRSDGLVQYCRLAVAESEGREGASYSGVCEGQLGTAFARVHAAAKDVHDATARLNSLDSEIDAAIRQLGTAEADPEQVAAIQRELRLLQAERERQQWRLGRLEADLARTREIERRHLAGLGISA